jgi:hypothetical protein
MQVLPFVAKQDYFALKGGTAIDKLADILADQCIERWLFVRIARFFETYSLKATADRGKFTNKYKLGLLGW